MSPDYGQMPEEGEADHKHYEKAIESLTTFSHHLEHLKGHNQENLEAMVAMLHWMLADDYNDSIPEGKRTVFNADEDSYKTYLQALSRIEQYIQENKPAH